MLYHLADAAQWAQQYPSGSYQPESFTQEGFIHCASRQQLEGVAQRYYCNTRGLIVLVIDPQALHASVVAENTTGGEELFPHVYGVINCDAVVATLLCQVTAQGQFVPSLDQIDQ